MELVFEKVTEKVRFRSPLLNMEEVEHVIERRRDPLTGRWALGSDGLKGKGAFFFGPTDEKLLADLAAQSRENCFFCPENLASTTPRYLDEWLEGGWLQTGDATLIPNLFPLSAVHAVVVLGSKHMRRLDDFPPDLLADGLAASVRFTRSVHAADAANSWFTINANYLFPAGASIVHPHLQVFGGRYPATASSQLQADCQRFADQHGRPYFDQLIAKEQDLDQRYVTQCGPVHWLAPFAPLGTNEMLGILPEVRHLNQLDSAALFHLAEGISKILAYYHKMGFSTFNFSIYSAPVDADESSFPVLIRLICRQNVHANYRTDDYFIQKLLGEEIVLTPPEDLARGLRAFW